MGKNFKKTGKWVIDLILILSLIGCYLSTDTVKGHKGRFRSAIDQEADFSWGTLHSIFSIIFTLLIVIHLIQNWKLIKGIFLKNLYSRNILTTITFFTFTVTVISFLIYLTGFNNSKGEFHGTVSNIFLITVCLHFVFNFKKLLILFDGTLIRKGSLLHAYISGNYTPKIETTILTLLQRNDSKKSSDTINS